MVQSEGLWQWLRVTSISRACRQTWFSPDRSRWWLGNGAGHVGGGVSLHGGAVWLTTAAAFSSSLPVNFGI